MNYFLAIGLILIAALATFLTKKLSWQGAIAGIIIAVLCFGNENWTLLACLAGFFALSTFATLAGKTQKLHTGLAERSGGPRLASQVLANGGFAALLSLASMIFPSIAEYLLPAAIASFSSATADTMSSEIGNAYGSRFINLINFRKGIRGNNGVISVEGTIAGILGSCVIAAIGWSNEPGWRQFFIIVTAGTAANFFDSLLGGTLENRQRLTNDQVNFLNTVFGAAVAVGLRLCLL